MSLIQIHDKQFAPYISREAISERIRELGSEISRDYKGINPLFIGILNGAFIFTSDLFRQVDTHSEVCFVKLVSYDGTSSTGTVVEAIGLTESLEGRHVIITEDILDTGKTLHSFIPQLLEQNPASLKTACMLAKPDALRYDVKADYIGFIIPDNFVIGYGLDYNGLGRNLPDIYVLADQ